MVIIKSIYVVLMMPHSVFIIETFPVFKNKNTYCSLHDNEIVSVAISFEVRSVYQL